MSKIEIIKKILLYIVTVSFIMLALSMFIGEITDSDIWFHLKTGEYIVKNRAIPKYDLYSYTAAGHKYIDSQWLFQVILYIFYLLGGISGLFLLQIIVLSLAYYFLILTGWDNKNYIVFFLIGYLSLMVSYERFIIRPEMFTILFITVYMFILEKYRETKNEKILYIIPVIQLLWTNIHGLFILGWIIMLIYIGSEYISGKIDFKYFSRNSFSKPHYNKLFMIAVLTVIVSFITPYGKEGITYPFLLYTEISDPAHSWMRSVGELQPPLSLTIKSVSLMFYKILIVVTLISFVLNYRKIRLSYLIITSVFFYLSLLAQRNIALFSFIAGISIAYNFNSVFRTYQNEKNKFVLESVKIVLSILLVYYGVRVVSNRYYIKSGILWNKNYDFKTYLFPIVPEKAVNFILENNIDGTIYNDNTIGGYLLWRFYPQRKVFVDGRWEVYGREFMDSYKSSLTDIKSFFMFISKYNPDCIILSFESLETQRLAKDIHFNPDWKLVYIDDIVLIYLKDNIRNANLIKKYQIDFRTYNKLITDDRNRYVYTPMLFEKGKFLYSIQEYKHAINEFTKIIECDPLYYGAYNNIGNCYMQLKDFQTAIKYYTKTIEIKDDYYDAIYNLAYAYKESGDFINSEKLFRKANSIKKDFVDARYNFGVVLMKNGKYDESIKEFEYVIKRNPDHFDAHMRLAALYENKDLTITIKHIYELLRINPEYTLGYYNLGAAYYRLGDRTKAFEYWKKFLKLNPTAPESKMVKQFLKN